MAAFFYMFWNRMNVKPVPHADLYLAHCRSAAAGEGAVMGRSSTCAVRSGECTRGVVRVRDGMLWLPVWCPRAVYPRYGSISPPPPPAPLSAQTDSESAARGRETPPVTDGVKVHPPLPSKLAPGAHVCRPPAGGVASRSMACDTSA